MPDLRALPIEQRRQLAAEAERRARAGETPTEIAAALGISITTYGRWASLYGFRLSDLKPDHPAGRGVHPAGTASGISGRYMLRQGLGGRVPGSGRPPGLDLEEARLHRAAEILDAVREAIEAGDRGLADQLVAAWNTKKRRQRALAALESEASQDAAADAHETMSDETLAAEVSAPLGRPVKLPNQAAGQGRGFGRRKNRHG